jgi:ATP/maltotriose-dependent transcriptional regulator MalT
MIGFGCAHSRNYDVLTPIATEQLILSGLLVDSVASAGRGRLLDAERQLRKAAWLDPTNFAVQFNLAVVLSQQGRLLEARQTIEKVIKSSGRRPDILVVLADIERQEGNFVQARAFLKDAYRRYDEVDNRKQATLLARSIANLAFVSGEEQEALCYSYEALRYSVDVEQVGYHGLLLLAFNQIELAHNFVLEQATAKRSVRDSGFVQFVLSLATIAKGNFDGGEKTLKLARRLSNKGSTYLNELDALQLVALRHTGENIQSEDERKRWEHSARNLIEQAAYQLLHWPMEVQSILRGVADDKKIRT